MWSVPRSPIDRRSAAVAFLTAGLLFFSCATRSALRQERFGAALRQTDFTRTADDVKKHADLYGGNDRFLYELDLGLLYHYAAAPDSSNQYLLAATDTYTRLLTRSISREAAAVLINDNARPYQARPYEMIWAHQACQLNFLAKGSIDDALVETRRAQLLFNEWQRQNGPDSERYAGDGMFHYLSCLAYEQAGQIDDAMISLGHAVRAFQRGPVGLPPGFAQYAAALLVKNDRADDVARLGLASADTSLARNSQAEIIAVGYAGQGPLITEEVWWGTWVRDGMLILHHTSGDGTEETMSLLAPQLPEEDRKKHTTKSGTTVFIKVALPRLLTRPAQTDYFTVAGAGVSAPQRTMVINDFDLQAAKQLADERPMTLARTVVRVVARTLAAQEAKEEMRTDSPLANLFVNLTTDVASAQLEKADTRSCFLIPRTVQIARLPVEPGTHSVTMTARDHAGAAIAEKTFEGIEVKPGQKKFIFFSSFQ
jgi:hypothetical protein